MVRCHRANAQSNRPTDHRSESRSVTVKGSVAMMLWIGLSIIFILSYLKRYRYDPVVLAPGKPGWHKWVWVCVRFTGNSIRVSVKLLLLLVGIIMLVVSLGAYNPVYSYQRASNLK